jgi:hypothetical protein
MQGEQVATQKVPQGSTDTDRSAFRRRAAAVGNWLLVGFAASIGHGVRHRGEASPNSADPPRD